MDPPQHCRENAAECANLAREAATNEERDVFAKMARELLQAAMVLERRLPDRKP